MANPLTLIEDLCNNALVLDSNPFAEFEDEYPVVLDVSKLIHREVIACDDTPSRWKIIRCIADGPEPAIKYQLYRLEIDNSQGFLLSVRAKSLTPKNLLSRFRSVSFINPDCFVALPESGPELTFLPGKMSTIKDKNTSITTPARVLELVLKDLHRVLERIVRKTAIRKATAQMDQIIAQVDLSVDLQESSTTNLQENRTTHSENPDPPHYFRWGLLLDEDTIKGFYKTELEVIETYCRHHKDTAPIFPSPEREVLPFPDHAAEMSIKKIVSLSVGNWRIIRTAEARTFLENDLLTRYCITFSKKNPEYALELSHCGYSPERLLAQCRFAPGKNPTLAIPGGTNMTFLPHQCYCKSGGITIIIPLEVGIAIAKDIYIVLCTLYN